MKKNIRIITTLMMLAVMIMQLPVLAASHDPVENVSSDTATIYLGKVLTVSQSGKFPNVNDFNFSLVPVKAWDNANKDTTKSGNNIAADSMPLPQAASGDHQIVRINGHEAQITVGDFRGTANTSKADTDKEKFRVTPVSIKFTKAGYYMYKVSETGSAPASVPGVAYDADTYYIVVYVCNKTDSEGNTVNGVYVHDITSYRNEPGKDVMPDLSDIQKTTDNGGKAAAVNNYENLGKTGKSDPAPGTDPETGLPKGPDKLEAYKFFNDHTTHDVVITNNVTGNLGDRTKEFEITVTLTGLEKGVTYTTNIAAEGKTDNNSTSAGADLVSTSKGTADTRAKTFTADAEGNAEFLIRLADDEAFVMNSLPATSKYKAEEHASDHIASYTVTSTSDKALIAGAKAANTTDNKSIATSVETVDAVSNTPSRKNSEVNDGTVTIAFVNHRNLATLTGLPYYGDFAYIICGLALAAALLFLINFRRARSEE